MTIEIKMKAGDSINISNQDGRDVLIECDKYGNFKMFGIRTSECF
jgi:hypothetical protein